MYDEADFDVVDVVRALAAEYKTPMAQIALAWLLSKPAVSAPIVGATRVGHIDDALAALDATLSADDIARLEAPYQPHAVRGHS